MTAGFASITSEGGLLPADLLARIALLDKTVPGVSAADYRLEEGQRIGEAISRSWNRMLPTWRAFRTELALLPADDPATTLTRERFLQPLLEELKYGRVPTAKAIDVDGRIYAISHSWGNVPIHLLGARVSLEERTVGQVGAAKSSPHGLVQDLLNRSEPHLWGLLSNGLVLRLLRDHHSLTTQAYVEVDLEALFEGERYADFAVLWLVFHQSRIDPRDGTTATCWLETWFALSRDEGLSALDDLRDGVVEAIERLGVGFLRHPNNKGLHRDLVEGVLDRQDFYRELLRFAYRLIFLFSAEDRGVLLDPAAPELAQARYRRFYATRRLRELAGKSRGGPHADLWQALRAVMNGLDDGCPALALPALGSFLWSKDAMPHLDRCDVANADLLGAVQSLSYLRRHNQRFPVSWRTVAADELGSIYESLLELHPVLDAGAATFKLDTAAGNERKKTGSYYTPTSLVDSLLDSALDPVIETAAKGKSRADAENSLLALRIVDPACGSGHFLVAAARRLARRLATIRTGDNEPSPRELQRALRDVVGRCIYGVDLNEMAVELCKVALWMEALEPGKPLSFLDAHVQLGNALLGTTPIAIADGIPDDAWSPIAGDDDEVARGLKRRNRDARRASAQSRQGDMWRVLAAPGSAALATIARDALGGGDDTVEEVRARKLRWDALQRSQGFRDAVQVADTWCAAFVWPKQEGALAAEAPTEEIFANIVRSSSNASASLRRQVSRLAAHYTFFHWHLAFPDVYARSTEVASDGQTSGVARDGFDCVLGNPPWERIKLQPEEYFAQIDGTVAAATTASERSAAIEALRTGAPYLFEQWSNDLRTAEAFAHFLRASSLFPKAAQGDLNTYPLFAEKAAAILNAKGTCGLVLPQGIVTDKAYAGLTATLMKERRLSLVRGFINESLLFPAVQHNVKFCIFVFSGTDREPTDSRFSFHAHTVAESNEPSRWYTLDWDDISLLNPESLTCPILELSSVPIVRQAYRNGVLLSHRLWRVRFGRTLHTGSASKYFHPWKRGTLLPLFESKMIDRFNHRYGSFEHIEPGERAHILPAVPESLLKDPRYENAPCYGVKLTDFSSLAPESASKAWHLAYRRITNVEVERTVSAAVIPEAALADSLMELEPADAEEALDWLALYNSLAFDFIARGKLGGRNLSQYVFEQLAAPSPEGLTKDAPWDARLSAGEWLRERALRLTFTAQSLTSFARDAGFGGSPYIWDSAERELLEAEIDAGVMVLYGFGAEFAETILDHFRVLRERETAETGEYRTKRLVLERYRAIAGAIKDQRNYESPLSALQQLTRSAQPGMRVRRLQEETVATLVDNAWATPDGVAERDVALFALVEVLRCAGGPIEAERVRLASILVRKPAMAMPFMDADAQSKWSRLVGREAAPLPVNVLDLAQFKKNAVDHVWRDAVAQLTGSGVLVCDAKTKLWSASAELPSSKQPWVEGRAEMAMRLVRTLQLPKVEKQIASFLKDVKRGATAQARIS